jgi:hypothetical protein
MDREFSGHPLMPLDSFELSIDEEIASLGIEAGFALMHDLDNRQIDPEFYAQRPEYLREL